MNRQKDTRFKLFTKKVHVQTEFEKKTHWGLGPGPWPGPPGPWPGVFFQTQFENGPFFQNSLKKDPFFQTFLKMGPGPVFKLVTDSCFQSFTS